MVAKAFFMNVRKKNKTFCQKKSFRVFKGAFFGIFEHPKTFFWQNVFLFFCHIHEKCFCNQNVRSLAFRVWEEPCFEDMLTNYD